MFELSSLLNNNIILFEVISTFFFLLLMMWFSLVFIHQVLWPECGWQSVSLTDLITGASVKKVYRKATLCIHPDKVQQKGANLQQKYIAEKVFDLLKVLNSDQCILDSCATNYSLFCFLDETCNRFPATVMVWYYCKADVKIDSSVKAWRVYHSIVAVGLVDLLTVFFFWSLSSICSRLLTSFLQSVDFKWSRFLHPFTWIA